MVLVGSLWRRVYLGVAQMTWTTIGLLALVHVVMSYVLLTLAGEDALTGSAVAYLYYYVTTATTVGYGDLSPATQAGRIAGLAFVLPGSIALFTATLGKAIADLGSRWRRGMNGYGDYAAREGHTIVLGWQGGRSRRLVELLLADHAGEARIVLVAKQLEQNPMPDAVDYVRTDGLSNHAGLVRAGIAGATSVVVRGQDDDETLAATLAANAAPGSAHIVAHFEDEQTAELIARQCPEVEAIGSLSAELLVRSSRDPGASRVADLLFSAKSEDTAYSFAMPPTASPIAYLDALVALKRRHGITLVGVCREKGRDLDLNCAPDRRIEPGDTLFYIADARIGAHAVDWAALPRGTPPMEAAA